VTFVDPTEETLAEWDVIAANATTKLVGERGYDPKLYAEIQQLLEDYRAAHQSGK